MRAGSSSEITCDRKGSTSGTAPICDRKTVNFEIKRNAPCGTIIAC